MLHFPVGDRLVTAEREAYIDEIFFGYDLDGSQGDDWGKIRDLYLYGKESQPASMLEYLFYALRSGQEADYQQASDEGSALAARKLRRLNDSWQNRRDELYAEFRVRGQCFDSWGEIEESSILFVHDLFLTGQVGTPTNLIETYYLGLYLADDELIETAIQGGCGQALYDKINSDNEAEQLRGAHLAIKFNFSFGYDQLFNIYHRTKQYDQMKELAPQVSTVVLFYQSKTCKDKPTTQFLVKMAEDRGDQSANHDKACRAITEKNEADLKAALSHLESFYVNLLFTKSDPDQFGYSCLLHRGIELDEKKYFFCLIRYGLNTSSFDPLYKTCCRRVLLEKSTQYHQIANTGLAFFYHYQGEMIKSFKYLQRSLGSDVSYFNAGLLMEQRQQGSQADYYYRIALTKPSLRCLESRILPSLAKIHTTTPSKAGFLLGLFYQLGPVILAYTKIYVNKSPAKHQLFIHRLLQSPNDQIADPWRTEKERYSRELFRDLLMNPTYFRHHCVKDIFQLIQGYFPL